MDALTGGKEKEMEKSRILLMYAAEYSITDDGRTNEGCSLQYYFFGDNGEQISPQQHAAGSIGYQRAKCSIDISAREKVIAAPAVYDAEFTMSVGSDGKPVLKIANLEYVGPVEFRLHQNGGKAVEKAAGSK